MKYESIPTPSGKIVIPRAENYSDIITIIKSDVYRCGGGSVGGIIKKIFKRDVLVWFRLCQINDFWLPIKKRIYLKAANKRLIEIPINTKIGFGLYLGHSMGVVINETAVIGNNVNLSHFLTIGSNRGKAATIHDGVYLGPNVCVVESVDIGYNATVGAGAVVVKSIQENGVAVGCPAKVVRVREKEPWNFYPLPKECKRK